MPWTGTIVFPLFFSFMLDQKILGRKHLQIQDFGTILKCHGKRFLDIREKNHRTACIEGHSGYTSSSLRLKITGQDEPFSSVIMYTAYLVVEKVLKLTGFAFFSTDNLDTPCMVTPEYQHSEGNIMYLKPRHLCGLSGIQNHLNPQSFTSLMCLTI